MLALSENAAEIVNNCVTGAVGIAGAIIGVVVDRMLRRSGKVIFYTDEWRLFFEGRDAIGGVRSYIDPDVATRASYEFQCQIFNSKDEPYGLRRIRITFEHRGKIILADVPKDAATREDDVEVLNIAPKVWTTIRMRGWPTENLTKLPPCEVVLSGVDPWGKEIRHVVTRKAWEPKQIPPVPT